MHTQDRIAEELLDIGAVGFTLDNPITFKSGIVSPVYVDNRQLPYHPKYWKTVIKAFGDLIKEKRLTFDVIAGIETAGIPHSSALGFHLGKPSVFIRKAAKDHGTKKLIEGGDVQGKRVILIEDHVSTGGSSLHGVHALTEAGAKVTACLAITSYGWKEAVDAFAKEKVKLYTLTSFDRIFAHALLQGRLEQHDVDRIQEWIKDPHGWKGTV